MTSDGSHVSPSDTPSPIFPGRPIRPLPKRALRNRSNHDIRIASSDTEICRDGNGTPEKSSVKHHGYSFLPNQQQKQDGESSDVTVEPPNQGGKPSVFARPDDELSRVIGLPLDPYSKELFAKHAELASISMPSLASPVVDGYDAFENTNNKKKRKIPTSGGISIINPTSAEASLAASSAMLDELDALSFYNGDLCPPESISRPRAGRHGSRPGSGKSPHAIQSFSPYMARRNSLGEWPFFPFSAPAMCIRS